MEPTERILEEFDRLAPLGREEIRSLPFSKQVVFYVVVARTEAEMAGFDSIYEQALDADEMSVLIAGLRTIGEVTVADEFQRGFAALQSDDFYRHREWDKLPVETDRLISGIKRQVGTQLWTIDAKLVLLLDGAVIAPAAG